jgi:hypothetical protein
MQAVDVLAFSHLGFVVESVEEFRATWGALLGLDTWLVREVGQPPGRVQLHGQVVDEPTGSRVAFTKFRGTALELIEPMGGQTASAEWLATSGGGIQHIGVWVRDLPTELRRLGGDAEIVYSAASLHPGLAARPVAATVSTAEAPVRPPFWAYVEPLASKTRWALELLDAKFAADYREYYGNNAYYPGDLPDSSAL